MLPKPDFMVEGWEALLATLKCLYEPVAHAWKLGQLKFGAVFNAVVRP